MQRQAAPSAEHSPLVSRVPNQGRQEAARNAPPQVITEPETDLRTRILRVLGPAGLSMLCHTLVLFLLTFVSWAVGSTGDGLSTEFTASLLTNAEHERSDGQFRFPGQADLDQPDFEQQQESIQDLASLLKQDQSLQVSPVDVGDSGLKTLTVQELSRSDVVGAGVSVSDGVDQWSGLGDRNLAGGGAVGSLWGVGKGQQARSIVYVMDRSGSMSDTIDSLKRELLRAIGSLEPDQLFNVIWFNEGKATEWSTRMQKATFENKRKAFQAINRVVAAGQTEPIDAVRRSLGYRPDVMFLLSDGDFGEDNKRVIELIRKRKRRPIINTILFVYDTMGDGERVLRTIAELSGGTYKHVTEQDIRHR